MTSCIAVESYGHPGSHPPSIITQDKLNRFVTDDQIASWESNSDHQFIVTGNPHKVTAFEIGLGNCDNTSDMQKPVSAAVAIELAGKADAIDLTGHTHSALYNPTESIKALSVNSSGNVKLQQGISINEFSDDATMAGQSPYAVPTEKAVRTFVLNQIDGAAYTYLTSPTGNPLVAFSVSSTGRVACMQGVAIERFSDDATMVGDSDAAVPTEKAVKSFVSTSLAAYLPFKLGSPDGGLTNAFTIDNSGKATFPTGVGISRFSSDPALASNSDEYVPTEKAVKTYVDTELATKIAATHPTGINQTLTFAGTVSGEVQSMVVSKGVITSVTLVP